MQNFKFKIEHIAFQPIPECFMAARDLLYALGLSDWVYDCMVTGREGLLGDAMALTDLQFNYQATPDRKAIDGSVRPIELEIMHTVSGKNWLDHYPISLVSHFGMQVSWEELAWLKVVFGSRGIFVLQESFTQQHQNPHVQTSRRYFKRIYDTRRLLGVDLEFNVLIPLADVPDDGLKIPRDVPESCRI